MSAERFKSILFTPHGPNGPGFMLPDGSDALEALNGPDATDPDPVLQGYIDILKAMLELKMPDELSEEGDTGQIEDENLA